MNKVNNDRLIDAMDIFALTELRASEITNKINNCGFPKPVERQSQRLNSLRVWHESEVMHWIALNSKFVDMIAIGGVVKKSKIKKEILIKKIKEGMFPKPLVVCEDFFWEKLTIDEWCFQNKPVKKNYRGR